MDGNVVYKHCSERCKFLHFGNPSEVPNQANLLYLKVNRPIIDTILLQVTKVVLTEISANTILSIQLCLSCNHPKIPNDAPYALVQIRTTMKTTFLSFIVSPDMSPGEPLWYVTPPEKLDLLTDHIRGSGFVEALQFALAKNSLSDLPSLIMNSNLSSENPQ